MVMLPKFLPFFKNSLKDQRFPQLALASSGVVGQSGQSVCLVNLQCIPHALGHGGAMLWRGARGVYHGAGRMACPAKLTGLQE
jgi:hypothetical protein